MLIVKIDMPPQTTFHLKASHPRFYGDFVMPKSKRDKWIENVLSYEGRFQWAGSNPKDWDSEQDNLAMNCWCAPIYIAYKEGYISKKQVDGFAMMPFKFGGVGPLFQSQMAAYEFLQGDKSSDSFGLVGDILFFFVDKTIGGGNVDLSKAPVHVAVNLGDGNCMSLWTVPNNTDHFQNCRISTLKQEVETVKVGATCSIRSVAPFWILGKTHCYITTATCEALGKPDDCRELTLLRTFRDDILLKTSAGQKGVETYYEHAPAIVESINQRPDALQIYQQIYRDGILPSVEAIEAKDYSRAHQIFKEAVLELQEKYIGTPLPSAFDDED